MFIYSRIHSKLLDYQMKTWSKFFLTIYIRICTLRTLKSFYRLMKRTLWRYPEQLVLWWTPCTTSKPSEECYTRWTPTQGDLRVTEYFIFILVGTIFQHHHLINISFLPFDKEPTYLENNAFFPANDILLMRGCAGLIVYIMIFFSTWYVNCKLETPFLIPRRSISGSWLVLQLHVACTFFRVEAKYYTLDWLWRLWLVDRIQSIYNSRYWVLMSRLNYA